MAPHLRALRSLPRVASGTRSNRQVRISWEKHRIDGAWSLPSYSPSRCSTSPLRRAPPGHLLGGALAVILVGPWLGVTAVSVVVIIQALVIADGGVSALGANIFNMALVTGFVGWGVFRVMVKTLPRSWNTVLVSTFTAGWRRWSPRPRVRRRVRHWRAEVSTWRRCSRLAGVHFLIGVGEGLSRLRPWAPWPQLGPLIAGVADLDLLDKEKKPVRAGAWGFAAPVSR